MAIFRHILVPYDGSGPARRAADKAIDLAVDQKAQLTALKVINFLGELITPSDSLWETIEYDLQKKANGILEEFEQSARERDLKIHRIISEGAIENEVITKAEELNVDLIVMGASGTSGVDLGHRFGKNIQRIIMEASCPVMLVR